MANKQKARRKQQHQRRRQQKQQRRSRRGPSSRPSGSPASGSFDPLVVAEAWIRLQQSICVGDSPAGVQTALTRLLTCGEDARPIAGEALIDFLWDLWPSGWRPLEVVRQVRRSEKAAHASLTAVAVLAQRHTYQGQSRNGRPAFDDPEWVRELEQIGANYPFTQVRKAHLVADWAASAGQDLPSAVLIAAETVHALTHLPELDVVGPFPGGPVTTRGSREHLPPKVIDKVSALLRKAESTQFPEEADALTAKAQQIMTRHAFDHAVLDAEQAARIETPGLRRVPVDNPHADGRASLLHRIADATRCRSAWDKKYGWSVVAGFNVDIDAVELLYGSLIVQATKAVLSHGSIKDAHGRSRTAAFRKSFMLSFAQRIGERLRVETETTTKDAAEEYGNQLLPVLAARDTAVDELWAETHEPHVRDSRASYYTHSGGYATGRFAADQANLGQQATSLGD